MTDGRTHAVRVGTGFDMFTIFYYDIERQVFILPTWYLLPFKPAESVKSDCHEC